MPENHIRPARRARFGSKQIKDKGYQKILESYGGDVILVGINYDTETKEHKCVIKVNQK